MTSHYHILYVTKNASARPTFNTFCRFGPQKRTAEGGSALYQDLEDVWTIKREYQSGRTRNRNKLPEALVEKMILYSSNPGDVVCDFFLGNFTTAKVAKSLGRIPVGFEINPSAYSHHLPLLEEVKFGGRLLSEDEKDELTIAYVIERDYGATEEEAIEVLRKVYGLDRLAVAVALFGE